MKQKNQNLEKWTQALTLLFEACKPLTFDCILTKEEVQARDSNIERHTFYCEHVKGAIEDGVEPLSFDNWNAKATSFNVEAEVTKEDLDNNHFQVLMQALRRRFDKDIKLSEDVPNGPIDDVFLAGLPVEDDLLEK